MLKTRRCVVLTSIARYLCLCMESSKVKVSKTGHCTERCVPHEQCMLGVGGGPRKGGEKGEGEEDRGEDSPTQPFSSDSPQP